MDRKKTQFNLFLFLLAIVFRKSEWNNLCT